MEESEEEYRFNCTGFHKTLGMSKALGVSCNAYFASLAQELEPVSVNHTLEQLGFITNSSMKQSKCSRVISIGKLKKECSYASFLSQQSYDSIWGLVGQGTSHVNAIDMAMIAGAVANHGEAAVPFLVTGTVSEGGATITDDSVSEVRSLMKEQTADAVSKIWKKATNQYYRSGSRNCVSEITCAKTGTAEISSSKVNKLLLGVSEQYHTAFYIVVEDWVPGDPQPVKISTTLMNRISRDTKRETE